MSYPAPIKNITRSSGTATTTPAKVPANQKNGRSCVKLTNTGVVPIYVYLTNQNDAAPTISGADFDFPINPDEFLAFPAGDSIGVWIATLSSTATYVILEADGDPAALAATSVSGSATISGTVSLASEKDEGQVIADGEKIMGVGFVAQEVLLSQVAADSWGAPKMDTLGKVWVKDSGYPFATDWYRSGTITTATTTNVKNDSAGSNYLTDIALSNLGSAANTITIQDQNGTPNVLFIITLQGGQGCIVSFNRPRVTASAGASGIDIVTSSGEDINYSLGGF